MFREDWLFYDPRRDGWGFLAAYELGFGLYFFAWEWFFRGWLLGRLAASYGAGAIALQTVPFVLMHIGKPGPELHSSVIAGLVLGWLAWRGRSVWPCFLVHWGAALTMDLTALYHSLPPATK
jgi:membrane protease YdiL (CAAX protease family)